MNHLFDILQTLDHLPATQEAVLATVVWVEGSAYRQPGARMLILADGQAVGMVSGGCLEKHLVQRAFWLTRHGAVIQTYHTAIERHLTDDDLSDEHDEQQGFGLGCQGSIQVLFERINMKADTALVSSLTTLKHDKKTQTLATIIATNSPTFEIGQHFNLTTFGLLVRDWQLVSRQAASRKSRFEIVQYQRDDEQISVFIETLTPPLQLLIFGAGQDCLPLISMAHLQGWQVTVIDSRLDLIRRYLSNPQAAFRHIPLEQASHVQSWFDTPQQTAVVIMTHSLSQDKVWLSQVLCAQYPPLFIGQLGPRYRTEQLLSAIDTVNKDDAPPTIPDNLFYPVGLPLGGDTPEAVALSITAQIQQVYSRHVQAVEC